MQNSVDENIIGERFADDSDVILKNKKDYDAQGPDDGKDATGENWRLQKTRCQSITILKSILVFTKRTLASS